MAENSRIEDLRKRYHENPRRFFAPLANEYRKAGFLDRALLLCQKHVSEQPDNMNGLVVFGQTLFESGHTAEAREPFERALTVDPENLIALRHLGDIARIGGDLAAAKQWYGRVLELDRRNDDVLDLMQQMGFGEAAPDAPSESVMRPTTTAGGLVSVAASVSVSGGAEMGMIDLDMPTPPATPVAAAPQAAGPGRTKVINAQALADRDRGDASGVGDETQRMDAVVQPVVQPVAAARPSKRASLLDIGFDFSETAEAVAAPVVPAAPVTAAEGAESGFVVETTGDVAPLGLAPTVAGSEPGPVAALPAGDFELADYSAQVSPIDGLEATESTSEEVAPLADLDNDTASASLPSFAPLAGLDRPDVEPGSVEPLSGISDLPLLGEAESPSVSSAEPPSVRAKPRMTRANLSSLPLIADFGLEDDESASTTLTPIVTPAVPPPVPTATEASPLADLPALELSSATPTSGAPARASKATPAFVTETMAALYVQQGHLGEAIGVYRQLVAQSPNDSGLRAKLLELERMRQAELAPPAAPVESEMPEFEEPADFSEPEPAAANAAMAEVSFGGIGLQGQGSTAPVLTPAAPSGPSAREFFGGFARRAAVAAAVMAVAVVAEAPSTEAELETVSSTSGSAWPLDALFGAAQEVRDLHAAGVLAGVGTFEGPDGGTGLDALFAEQAPPAPPARRSVPRASEMLKFDQFFQTPGSGPAPQAAAPTVDAAAPGDDELNQFHGWLKGLKK